LGFLEMFERPESHPRFVYIDPDANVGFSFFFSLLSTFPFSSILAIKFDGQARPVSLSFCILNFACGEISYIPFLKFYHLWDENKTKRLYCSSKRLEITSRQI
jgi:hypothetical protein